MKQHLLSTFVVCCAGLFVSAQTTLPHADQGSAALPYQIASHTSTFRWKNPTLSAQERAKDLCSRLTLEEKAQLMLDESPAIPRLGIQYSRVFRIFRKHQDVIDCVTLWNLSDRDSWLEVLFPSPSTGGMQTAMVYLPFRAPEK